MKAEEWVKLVHVLEHIWEEFYITFMTDRFDMVEKVSSTLNVGRGLHSVDIPHYLKRKVRIFTYFVATSARVICPANGPVVVPNKTDFLKIGSRVFREKGNHSTVWKMMQQGGSKPESGDTIILEDSEEDNVEPAPTDIEDELVFASESMLVVSSNGVITPVFGDCL